MKLYNLTNNAENWKHLYQSIEDKNWEFVVKTGKRVASVRKNGEISGK